MPLVTWLVSGEVKILSDTIFPLIFFFLNILSDTFNHRVVLLTLLYTPRPLLLSLRKFLFSTVSVPGLRPGAGRTCCVWGEGAALSPGPLTGTLPPCMALLL